MALSEYFGQNNECDQILNDVVAVELLVVVNFGYII